ncbi:helix-turn-helix transcriptional regulator [Patulibacter defluvii]|uniref:helix-turn-helix transcriptional regulator n=1 Tax=Patulibacter defluvii TaxID=3095358 RepID=UPI002A74A58A|nr:AAA family ATPase [Patulibacter sp. DM4]
MGDRPLLEREEELDEIADLVARAAAGDGGVAIVEGAAGLGKTALLRAGREIAGTKGLTVQWATASRLDRDFAFGVVRQLLEPALAAATDEQRERILGGYASHAEPVLGGAPTGPADAALGHAVLHGLYWAVANLAEEGPLALFVDDLQWADEPSLRLLEFVGRRLDGVPVVVAGSVRTGEPDAPQELLEALRNGPRALVLQPDALSEQGVAAVLEERLGQAPEERFVRTVREACGGNPLLLNEVARSASERGLRGIDADADQVRRTAGSDLAATIRRRLTQLGDAAATVAQAIAILDRRATVPAVSAVTGLDAQATARAIDLLIAAQVLADDAVAFVHPLVREAVVATLAPGLRAALHGAVARRLADEGAAPDVIAPHLLAVEPAGDPWVARTLAAAADSAASEGADRSAVALRRRALAEPPPDDERLPMLIALGEGELAVGEASGMRRLQDALAAGAGGDHAARCYAAIATVQFVGSDPGAALSTLEAGIAAAEDPGLADRLRGSMLEATLYSLKLGSRHRQLLERFGNEIPDAPSVLLHQGYDLVMRDPADPRALELIRRAIGDERLVAVRQPFSLLNLAVHGMRHLERFDLVEPLLTLGGRLERERGSLMGRGYNGHARAITQWSFGSLASAEGAAREAMEATIEADFAFGRLAIGGVLCDVLVERGELEEATALIEEIGLDTPVLYTSTGPATLACRGWIRRLNGRLEEAEADLRRAIELKNDEQWISPTNVRAGVRLVELLASTDRRDEAVELAREEVERGRRTGLSGATGVALSALGLALGDEEGIATLREAEELLAESPLGLDRAWARYRLGLLLRRARKATEAREPLREALAAADQLGAARLAGLARDELAAAGARPRRTALRGPSSLTPAERRVAELATKGLGNREIAETLWVTRKTVEVHLGNAYGKLGIRSRTQLAEALGLRSTTDEPAVAATGAE